jgi:hypothetical protein
MGPRAGHWVDDVTGPSRRSMPRASGRYEPDLHWATFLTVATAAVALSPLAALAGHRYLVAFRTSLWDPHLPRYVKVIDRALSVGGAGHVITALPEVADRVTSGICPECVSGSATVRLR